MSTISLLKISFYIQYINSYLHFTYFQSVFGRGEQVSANYAMTAKGGTLFNVTGLEPFLGWQKYSSAGVSLFRSTRNSEWNKTNVGEDGLLFNFQRNTSTDDLPNLLISSGFV